MQVNFDIPDKMLPLFSDDWDFFGAYGGRMGTKSETVARWHIMKVMSEQSQNVKYGFFREVQKSLSDSVKSLLERIIYTYGLEKYFYIGKTEIVCKINDVPFVFSGLLNHTLASIKSFDNVKYAWVEEAQSVSQASIEILEPTIIRNPGAKIIYTWNTDTITTPIHQHMIVNPQPNTKIVNINYTDVKRFLNKTALNIIENLKKTNYAAWLHIYMGGFKQENKNAIWNVSIINKNRIDDMPDLKLVVIGVDPSGGDTQKSKKGGNDEWGIVAVGITHDNIVVVLEDGSGTYKPKNASGKISELYERWKAGFIVAEDNYGGQMVSTVIKSENRNMVVNLVRAISSKRYRANEVLNQYERDRVKHYGHHGILENQMTDWDEDKKYSPDRLDAMVHAQRFLFKLNRIGSTVYAA